MEVLEFTVNGKEMVLAITDEVDVAIGARSAGFCPVECAFGSASIIDEFGLDHHGPNSHLPPACLQAAKAAGARSDDPRFVVTGAPDADATLAVLIMAGLLDPEQVPELLRVAAQRDVDPHVDMLSECFKHSEVCALLHFQQQRWGTWKDALVGLLTAIEAVKANPSAFSDILENEAARVALAEQVAQAGTRFGEVLLVDVPEEMGFGFDVWYRESPLVVAYIRKWNSITVGAADMSAAQRYGHRGLLDFFADCEGAWGGRETVGGSPRGQEMAWSEAVSAAKALCAGTRLCQCGSGQSWHSCLAATSECG